MASKPAIISKTTSGFLRQASQPKKEARSFFSHSPFFRSRAFSFFWIFLSLFCRSCREQFWILNLATLSFFDGQSHCQSWVALVSVLSWPQKFQSNSVRLLWPACWQKTTQILGASDWWEWILYTKGIERCCCWSSCWPASPQVKGGLRNWPLL